eukprot:gene5038-biopygen4099
MQHARRGSSASGHTPEFPQSVAFSALDQGWQNLMANSLAANTQKTYASAQKRFIAFCAEYGFLNRHGSPFPVSELTLLRFISSLSPSCKASSIKVYLSAVRALQLRHGFCDPLDGCVRVPMAIRGLRRQQAAPPKQKMPITPFVLRLIKLELDMSRPDDIMFWAACLTAFFGFLRASEFTVPPEGFTASKQLTVDDISIDQHPVPDRVFLRLRFSKTDQFGKGCTVIFPRTSGPLCPVAALLTYLARRGGSSGPLFIWAHGAPLTKQSLNAKLQAVLRQCGWPKTFSLHSFRVGAATTAAAAGLPDYLFQALGRWSSTAYKAYIKLPQSQLITASYALSQGAQDG